MTLYKKGTVSSSIVVSSSVYACNGCDYTEIMNIVESGKFCPKCGLGMTIISSHAEQSDDQKTSNNQSE